MGSEQQPTAAPMIGQLAEPAARTAAWGTLAALAAALAVATARNLMGAD